MTGDVLTRFPELRGDARAMAMMCAAMRRMDRMADAVALGLAATAAAPESMEVRNIVGSALSGGIPPFHAKMLRDEIRNHAYVEAIGRAVRPGMKVLEVGAGSGLLAMAAARAGATVVTCEQNQVIAAAATEIVARNGFADRVKVVAKRSTQLEMGVDIDEPADLLIHEIFGEYLFNEAVEPSITDARARLLVPGAPALPPRAELRCALVTINAKPRASVGMVEGFDLSAFNVLFRPAPFHAVAGDTGFTTCSEVHSALAMDYDRAPPYGARRQTIAIESTGGRVDAVLQWLRIDFGDGHVLENDPRDPPPRSSWVAPFFELITPIDTAPGDVIEVSLFQDGHYLSIAAERALG